jgi:transcriptional regulator with XRE-family HTH domain
VLKKVEQTEFYKRLGANIRSIREEKRFKQDALGTHLGFSRISISNIETGKQKIQLHSLLELAEFLNTPLQEIVPNLNTVRHEHNSKLEKKVTDIEVTDSISMQKIKDFIRLSTSNSK